MPVINSLAGFAIAATIGISAIIGSLIGMSWVEQRVLRPELPPAAARGQERLIGKLVAEYRSKRAERARNAPGRLRALDPLLAAGYALVELVRAGTVRPPPEPAGGPGAMRRPGR